MIAMAPHGPWPARLLTVAVSLVLAGSSGLAAVSASTGAAGFEAKLTVVVSLDGGKTKVRTEVTCPGATRVACRSLKARPEVLWPSNDRVCTQIYGGPERARIRGQVDGRQVDVVIQRNDGCGIDDWDSLRGVLPRI